MAVIPWNQKICFNYLKCQIQEIVCFINQIDEIMINLLIFKVKPALIQILLQMNKISKIFNCCTSPSIDQDKEIVTGIKRIKRCMSSNDGEKRTFIKRSVGKNPILDLNYKCSNKTISSIGAPLEMTKPQSGDGSSKDQLAASHLNKQHTNYKFIFKSGKDYSKNIERFINYQDFNSRKATFNESQSFFDAQIKMNPRIPRLFQNRREIKDKEHYRRKDKNLQLQTNNMLPITIKQEFKTIPQFQYKEDVLASNEAMHQTKQISEMSMLKASDTKEITQIRCQSSSFNEMDESNIKFSNNICKPFVYETSYNKSMDKEQISLDQQQNLVLSQLQMQNKILQMQLNHLKEQQNYLRQQRQLQNAKYKEELDVIHRRQMQLKDNLLERQNQINQIRQLILIQTKQIAY